MTFEPKTFDVDLAGKRDPAERAGLIIGLLPEATQKLGKRPTHVLCDSRLRLNIEMLEVMGLAVRRWPVGWPSRYLVRLAVEAAEVPRSHGGPARIAA